MIIVNDGKRYCTYFKFIRISNWLCMFVELYVESRKICSEKILVFYFPLEEDTHPGSTTAMSQVSHSFLHYDWSVVFVLWLLNGLFVMIGQWLFTWFFGHWLEKIWKIPNYKTCRDYLKVLGLLKLRNSLVW